jgi:hypothetical protein
MAKVTKNIIGCTEIAFFFCWLSQLALPFGQGHLPFCSWIDWSTFLMGPINAQQCD